MRLTTRHALRKQVDKPGDVAHRVVGLATPGVERHVRIAPHLQAALRFKETQFEPGSPSIARTRVALAEAALRRGNLPQARALLTAAEAAYESAYAEKPWRFGYLREAEGRLALAQRNTASAIALFHEARDMRIAEFGADHPRSLYVDLLLAGAALAEDDHESASGRLDLAASLRNLAPTHPSRVEWELLNLRVLQATGNIGAVGAAVAPLRRVLSDTYPLRQDWLDIMQQVQ